MIELHGGALELKSELGVGTEATMIFPPALLEMQPPKPVSIAA